MVPSRSTFPHHIHITITPLGGRQSPSAMSFRIPPPHLHDARGAGVNPHQLCLSASPNRRYQIPTPFVEMALGIEIRDWCAHSLPNLLQVKRRKEKPTSHRRKQDDANA